MKKKFDNTDNLLGGIVKKVRQEKDCPKKH